jgi:RNA polymerase sigma-70 factor, ECF subfamily
MLVETRCNMARVFTEPVPESLTDMELVQRAQKGDLRAFELLYSAHKKRIFTLCLRMAGDRSLAEDFTQEVFLSVFRHIRTFRGVSTFSSWVHRIAVNVVFGDFRKRKCRPDIVSDGHSDCKNHDEQDFDTIISRWENCTESHPADRIAIERAIGSLPDGYRLIFHLHDVEGYNHEEIAEILGCTAGTSKSQLHKARLALRRHMLTTQGVDPRHRCIALVPSGRGKVANKT